MDACTLVCAHGRLKVFVGFSVDAYQCIYLCVYRVPVNNMLGTCLSLTFS